MCNNLERIGVVIWFTKFYFEFSVILKWKNNMNDSQADISETDL